MTRGTIVYSSSTLARIIEHFGLSLSSFGFRPGAGAVGYADLAEAVKTRPGAGMLLTAAQVAYSIDSISAEDFTEAPCLLAQRVLDLVRETNRVREGYRHDDAHAAADHAIAVAALVATDRMSPELLTALLCRVKA